jgi:uncharacterized protein (DUF924 family)
VNASNESLISEVLTFWFANALESVEAARARSKVWFANDPQFDAETARRFSDLPIEAAAGSLDSWMNAAESALARVIVLDQFPRNLYRGDARAFAFDALALAGSISALERGFSIRLHPVQTVFLLLPLEHAEDRTMQQRSVALFEELRGRAPAGCEPQFDGYADYARRHRDVIERFGRFPHRNAVLGRTSTPEERKYLESGGEHFGAKRR